MYVKITKSIIEYSGESVNKPISKESGLIWTANEEANYIMYDNLGATISTGDLTKSVDNLDLNLAVPYTDTEGLEGTYVLLVFLIDTIDLGYKNIIAEYRITYKKRKA